MENILTREEKIYLNRTCNYLASMGMRKGQIGFDLDYEQDELTHDDISWEFVTTFDNNYRAELPEGLVPILKKIMDYFISQNIFKSPGIDAVNYHRLYLDIDCGDKELSIKQEFSYYSTGGEEWIEYNSDEDKARFDKWMEEDMGQIEVPSDGILTAIYTGGGDSGYIEGSFEETGDAIPSSVENWCYDKLESNFGGWEINEGSNGKIIFDFNESTVLFEHVANVEETETNTLFEISFSL
jgi:hypothetical protein